MRELHAWFLLSLSGMVFICAIINSNFLLEEGASFLICTNCSLVSELHQILLNYQYFSQSQARLLIPEP